MDRREIKGSPRVSLKKVWDTGRVNALMREACSGGKHGYEVGRKSRGFCELPTKDVVMRRE